MGNKFLALRKSEVAKAAQDRASIPSSSAASLSEVKAGMEFGREVNRYICMETMNRSDLLRGSGSSSERQRG